MVTFIIILFLFISFGIYKGFRDKEMVWFHIGIETFFGIIIGFFGACIVPNESKYTFECHRLISVKTSENINCSFIFGCGDVNSGLKINCIYNTSKGYKFFETNANNVIVQENKKSIPMIIIRRQLIIDNIYSFNFNHSFDKECIFIVPTNTIKKSFNINLK